MCSIVVVCATLLEKFWTLSLHTVPKRYINGAGASIYLIKLTDLFYSHQLFEILMSVMFGYYSQKSLRHHQPMHLRLTLS